MAVRMERTESALVETMEALATRAWKRVIWEREVTEGKVSEERRRREETKWQRWGNEIWGKEDTGDVRPRRTKSSAGRKGDR